MKTYLVGGAVRDQLLGLTATEHDHLVVGATPADLLRLGYQQVGKDFPVFLHPDTKEEYALARTERKTAPGYHGFSVHAATDVTLEQDLLRRDLTLNAIAQDDQGTLFDPYNGQLDIQQRRLRHVSDAFTEDPLRVLRLARFHAHLHHLGFTIAPTTLALAKHMVAEGELSTIAKERLWTETHKALQTQSPWMYFVSLHNMGAWQVLAPDIAKLWQTKLHNMSLLQYLSAQVQAPNERLAILLHTFNKPQLEALSRHLHFPKHVLDLCVQLSKHRRQILHYRQLNAKQRHRLLTLCHALKEKDAKSLKQLAHLCSIMHSHGQLQLHDMDFFGSLWEVIWTDLTATKAITAAPFLAQGITGKAIGHAIEKAQIAALSSHG